MRSVYITLSWVIFPVAIIAPIAAAAVSPPLAWRDPIYILAGFAGVVAMWAVFAAAMIAALRTRLRVAPRTWRRSHAALVSVVVLGSSVHALLIEGTMEALSKAALCILVVAAAVKAQVDLRIWARRGVSR